MSDHRPNPRVPEPAVNGAPGGRNAFTIVAGAATVLLLLLALLAPIYLSGSLPAHAGDDDPGSEGPDRTPNTREDLPEERRNEAAFEDPEGTAQARAARAAENYVRNVHTHADDGRSPEDQAATYTSRVAEVVDPGGFVKSPGAVQVDQRARAIQDGESADVAARFVAFETAPNPTTDASGAELITGTVTYELGTTFDAEGAEGALLGEEIATYEQDLELVPWGATYRVKGAGEPRPVAEGEES